jgi:Glycoside hydrolase 123, catalytic domain
MSFGFDEVGEQENPEVLSALKTCKKLFPDVVTVTTATGIKKMPECYKYLDYMCPVNCRFFNNIEKSLNDKYGTKSWIYVGGGASYPYPSFERLDQPRINSRAFFWVCARYDIKGWLYWAINMWRFNAKVTKKWPEIWDEWDPSYSFTTNGMGALMYPGPNNTAMPSARLEAMRDGIEDYNYFKIAEEMLKARKFDNAEQQKEIADFVEKSKHILSPGFTGFLEKTDEFNKLRDKLASYIEKMNRLPLK